MVAAAGLAPPRLRAAPVAAQIAELLRDPSPAEWGALARFDGVLTRADFLTRLDKVYDPSSGLAPYLREGSERVVIYPEPGWRGLPVAEIRFAATAAARRPAPVSFRSPPQFRASVPREPSRPLAGLRIALEPADIGGRWAKMEDRSVEFRGYGRINEGDLNLIVGELLSARLTRLGATVFLVRRRAEPVVPFRPEELTAVAAEVVQNRPWMLPDAYRLRLAAQRLTEPEKARLACELLLTKTLETRARAALVRREFTPDLTIVLQHDATPDSGSGALASINRNIFFVNGAYSPSELSEPEQRFRLLTKLEEGVTPIETAVAARIAERFQARTGFPPLLFGNSAHTLLVAGGGPYVVARNLAFNREHDGPVVVTEPYFMNQPETLARLLAGDYAGERRIAGKWRTSIYREYADCVAEGVVAAYGAGAGGE